MDMDQKQQKPKSVTKVIASGGTFQVELVKYAGANDNERLIEVSESLAEEYGPAALLTENTIQIYFNRKGTLPENLGPDWTRILIRVTRFTLMRL